MSEVTLPIAGESTRHRRWRALVLGAVLYAALLGLELTLFPIGPRAPVAPAPAAESAIDPRLIIHARSAPIDGLIAGGVRVVGTLYPALPGRNTVRVLVQDLARRLGGRVEVVATMPGMVMTPARATLISRNGVYSGVLTLPMFGRYQASVALDTPSGRLVGTLALVVALPHL